MGLFSDSPRKSLKEKIEEFVSDDPFLIRKAVVMRYFNVPMNEVENLDDYSLDKWYNAAMHLVDLIDLAPFKNKQSNNAVK